MLTLIFPFKNYSYSCVTELNKYHKLGDFKQYIYCWNFWRLEIQNQGVGRAACPPPSAGENPSFLFQRLVVVQSWCSLAGGCTAISPPVCRPSFTTHTGLRPTLLHESILIRPLLGLTHTFPGETFQPQHLWSHRTSARTRCQDTSFNPPSSLSSATASPKD